MLGEDGAAARRDRKAASGGERGLADHDSLPRLDGASNDGRRMTMQDWLWTADGAFVALALVAGVADWRRVRRRRIDGWGWMPWRGVQVIGSVRRGRPHDPGDAPLNGRETRLTNVLIDHSINP